MSEFLRADYGDVVRVILPHPQDTSEFVLDDEGTAGPRDDGEEDSSPETPSAGDGIGIGELLVTLRTVSDRVLINSPFPCKVLELNAVSYTHLRAHET